MIIFVITLLSRIVKNDLKIIHDFERNSSLEAQWKLVKSEIFYPPLMKSFLCICVGTGF